MSARRELEDLRVEVQEVADSATAAAENLFAIRHAVKELARQRNSAIDKRVAQDAQVEELRADRDRLVKEAGNLRAELDRANAELYKARQKLFTESMRKIDTYTITPPRGSKPSRVAELEQENKDLRFILAYYAEGQDEYGSLDGTDAEHIQERATEWGYRVRYDDVTGETTIRYAPKDQFVDPREKENTHE